MIGCVRSTRTDDGARAQGRCMGKGSGRLGCEVVFANPSVLRTPPLDRGEQVLT